MKRPLVIAHRGFAAAVPENSIKAFKAAISAGADMIELDVRKTADDTLIVFHNKTFARKRIADSRYPELAEAAYRRGLRIPTLEEVLHVAAGKIRLDIELKERGYEREAVRLILTYTDKTEFLISSFFLKSLKAVKKAFPEVRVGFLMGPAFLRRIALRMYKGEYLIPHYKLATPRFLDRYGDRKIYLWTVNQSALLKRFVGDKRIDGIITDRPDLALALRNRL